MDKLQFGKVVECKRRDAPECIRSTRKRHRREVILLDCCLCRCNYFNTFSASVTVIRLLFFKHYVLFAEHKQWQIKMMNEYWPIFNIVSRNCCVDEEDRSKLLAQAMMI